MLGNPYTKKIVLHPFYFYECALFKTLIDTKARCANTDSFTGSFTYCLKTTKNANSYIKINLNNKKQQIYQTKLVRPNLIHQIKLVKLGYI